MDRNQVENHEHEFESLNVEDLDVQELEHRLELAPIAALDCTNNSGWSTN